MDYLCFSFVIYIGYVWLCWITGGLENETFFLYFVCIWVTLNVCLLSFFPSIASGWFLEKVEITDASTNEVYCFNCSRSVSQYIKCLHYLESYFLNNIYCKLYCIFSQLLFLKTFSFRVYLSVWKRGHEIYLAIQG